jgi:hypothetical protein
MGERCSSRPLVGASSWIGSFSAGSCDAGASATQEQAMCKLIAFKAERCRNDRETWFRFYTFREPDGRLRINDVSLSLGYRLLEKLAKRYEVADCWIGRIIFIRDGKAV